MSETVAIPLQHRPEPARSKPLLSNGVLGMMIFIFTEVMLFAGFISAH
ncbi:uncharacterized protein METZ01_LOCUS380910, partial [marine metagenome]